MELKMKRKSITTKVLAIDLNRRIFHLADGMVFAAMNLLVVLVWKRNS